MVKEFKGVQADILKAEKQNQLVSAGAGSGKTTVMIEKISNLLLSGKVEIENLLVVTFTVLAAQEMKERLIKNLKEVLSGAESDKKEKILDMIEKIDTASIDTIDGFASKTIKKYFYDLQINPNIEIVSDTIKDYYLTKAMKKTFEDLEKRSDDMIFMLDLFGGNRRNLDTLKELIMDSYNAVINIEDYKSFIEKSLEEYQDSVLSENIVNSHLCEYASKTMKLIIESFSTFNVDVQEKLHPVVDGLQEFNKFLNFKANLQVFKTMEKPKFTKSHYDKNAGLKELNVQIKNFFEFREVLEENQIDENYEEKNKKIIKYYAVFIELLNNFIENYKKIKEKNNLIDFNDLNRLMLKLLENKNIQNELQDKFKYIFIDEYQDVNPLQDSLMSKLTGKNTTVFMVGDVKQSIYGFRGSSPEWFLNKYNKMKQNQTREDVFDMNINFRSSPTVLEFINLLFSKLMTKEIADIDYKNDCIIEPQRDDIKDDKVKILLIKEDKNDSVANGVYSVKNHVQDQGFSVREKEAKLVLKTITELIDTDFYDANLKQVRKLTYSDIAILTHSDKDESSKVLINLLKTNSVPLNLNNKLDVEESEVVKLVLSILKCVTRTADDVDYLATFLAMTDLTVDDVIEIRDKNFSFYENLQIIMQNLVQNELFLKISEGFSVLTEIEKASQSMTNRELISFILNKKKLKYYILKKPYGEKELELLEEFLLKLTSFEDSLGLAEFIEVVESNIDSSADFATVDKEDSVTLQTIHKSKGLEYPVVILFNSSKQFSYLTEHKVVNFNADVGFGIDYFDTTNRVKMDSLTKMAIKLSNNKKGYKEELRLLYVALTRAKNKLIITGSVGDVDYSELKKTSYTNMLLDCFGRSMTDDKLESKYFLMEFIEDVDEVVVKSNSNERPIDVLDVNFAYPNQEKFKIALKNSVTGINKEINNQDKFDLLEVVNKISQYDVEDRVELGINYHKALELLDFESNYVKNSDIEGVDYDKVKIAHSKLSPLVKDAVKLHKEAEFMMYVPYCEIIPSTIEDKVLIQGVVDLIIEKENSVILVDYKFSKLSAKALKEKYAEQLNLYKLAIEKAFKKNVEQMYIYSIEKGELF